MRLLKVGSKGDAVKLWQDILVINKIDIGPAGVDGDFGSDTKEATIKFQKQVFPTQKNEWDGVVGDKTWVKGFESCK